MSEDILGGSASYITVDQVISSIRLQMRLETSDEDVWLEKLIFEGVRHLDAMSIFVKSFSKLTVSDRRAKLPQGYHSLIGLRIGCLKMTYVDKPFLDNCGCDALNDITTNGYQIVNGCIHFEDEIDEGTEVVIAYWGLNVDRDGLFLIHEDHERALTNYACWMYCLQNHTVYPANLAATYMGVWKAQKKWVKSNDVRDHFRKNKREMASTMRAIINAKTWDV